MTPEEMFLFDLQGFLILKNVLSREEVGELNAIADTAFPPPPGKSGERTATDILSWGPAYQALIGYPQTIPYLADLLGTRFRLDHVYGIFMNAGDTRGPMHGGEGGMDDWWYSSRNRIIRTGLCVVTYCLTPAAEGEGGFCCIPGSHKSPFIHAIPPSVKQFETAAAYVVQPVLEAGDVVIFTEALVHGTLPWRGPHERRVLLFKYNPGHCASSGNYLDPAAFPFLTEQQRRILGPPSLYDRAEVLPESR